MADFDPAERTREAYEEAYGRVVVARAAWKAAGKPLTSVLNNGIESVHPLLKALQSCEAETARRLEEAKIKHRGPQPKAVVQATIGESPAQKLRLAK